MKSRTLLIIVLAATMISVSACGSDTNSGSNDTSVNSVVQGKSMEELGIKFNIDNDTISYHPENCQLRFDMTLKNDLFEAYKFIIEPLDIDGSTEYVNAEQPYVVLGSGVVADDTSNTLYSAYAINFNKDCQIPHKVNCRLVLSNDELDVKIVSAPFSIDIDNKQSDIAYLDESETTYNLDESKYNIIKKRVGDKNIQVFGNNDLGFVAVDEKYIGDTYRVYPEDKSYVDVANEKFMLTIKHVSNDNTIEKAVSESFKDSYYNKYIDEDKECTVQWYTTDSSSYAEMLIKSKSGQAVYMEISTSMTGDEFKDFINTLLYSYTEFEFNKQE